MIVIYGVVARRTSSAWWTSVYWGDRPDPSPAPTSRDHDARSQSRAEGRLPRPQLERVQRRPGPPRLAHPLGRPGDAPGVAIPRTEPAGCPVPIQRHGDRVPPDAPGGLP